MAGFQALSIPREQIPIGARWVQDRGPAGPGADPANVAVQRSLDNRSINEDLRTKLDTTIASHLGLSGEVARKVSIDFGALTVHTVNDLMQLNLQTGQSVLYEGLKVASIAVTYDNSLEGTIRATASAKKIPILSSVEGASKSTITFGGNDLFIAYRVMQLEHGGTEVEKTDITTDNSRRIRLGDFEFSINMDPVAHCFCAQNRQPGRIVYCHETVGSRIKVRSEARMSLDGTPHEEVLMYRAENWDEPYRLGVQEKGDEIVASFLRVKMHYDAPINDYLCMVSVKEELSSMELSTTRLRLVPLWLPRAPGW